MRKRVLRVMAIGAVVAASLAAPSAARAETCTPLPGGTSGATIEAGGQTIRIPTIWGLQLCTERPGAPGVVRVDYAPTDSCVNSCYSIIVGGDDAGSGYVAIRYISDGTPGDITIPLSPGGTGQPERCIVGIGSPAARPDCDVKVSLDNAPPGPPFCINDSPICIPPETPIVLDDLIDWLRDQTCIKPDVCD
jgi:hypothetical protein